MGNGTKLNIVEALGGEHFTVQRYALDLPRALPCLTSVVEHDEFEVVVSGLRAFPAVGFTVFVGHARLDGGQAWREEVAGSVPYTQISPKWCNEQRLV